MSAETPLAGQPGPRALSALVHLLPILQAAGLDGVCDSIERVILDVAAVQEYTEQQERNLHEMCVESLDSAREITQLRSKLDEVTRGVEAIYEVESEALRIQANRFSALCTIRDALKTEAVRPFVIPVALHGRAG